MPSAGLQNHADEKSKATHAYFTQNYFLTCEDYNHEAVDYIAEVLDCYEVREPRHAVHEVSGLNNSFRSSSHLPRINLPIFDGSFDKWESFRDKFKSMIHEDQSLTNVERMHYLCFCVNRDASNALDHLAVTNI